MTMQQMALKNEDDPASKERLDALNQELENAQEELRGLEARWEQEKSGLNRVGDVKKQIDQLRVEADKAQREGDLTRASQILYAEIPAAEKELAQAEATDTTPSMVSEEVSDGDIAEVVAAWTGIPVGKLLQGEQEKLLQMEAVSYTHLTLPTILLV